MAVELSSSACASLCFEVSIFAPNIIVGTWLRTVLRLPCDYVGGAQIGQVVEVIGLQIVSLFDLWSL